MRTIADLGIVADDLTGACDAAACFTPAAGSVGVCLSFDSPLAGGPALQVINTQSRLEDPQTAHHLLRRVGTALAGKHIVFKKIDTGLRGPIGAELAGLLEGLRDSGNDWSCVIAPAAPSIGRTTRNGVQYENGVPIHKSALSNDPHTPPPSANVRAVIEHTGGGDCLVCDAENHEDLQQIVDAHLQKPRVVFVGSLGLAEAIAGRLHMTTYPPATVAPARRPLLVCGSCHPRSLRQTEWAKESKVQVLSFDPARMRFEESVAPDWKATMLARILPTCVVGGDYPPQEITASFVAAIDLLLKEVDPDGLGVIGGETAYHLLQRVNAKRLEVYRRQSEVIACAKVVGGVMDGCRLVCKGGSVGPDDAAVQMLSLLTSAHYGIDR